MEEEKEAIYDIVQLLNIKIDHTYGEESNLDLSEINQYCYMNKCSILVLENGSMLFNSEEEKGIEIIEIEKKEFQILPSEMNIPRYKYKIISPEKTYLFFEGNNRDSLKEITEKKKNGIEEKKIRKYLHSILEQVKVLHSNGLVHGNLNPSYIVPYEKGVVILDSFLSTKIVEENPVKRRKIQKNFKYSSPEIIQNARPLIEEDDMWSIGMIALEMCLGEIPFDLDKYFNLNKEKIDELFREKQYSRELINIITELLFSRKVDVTLKIKEEKSKRFKYWRNKRVCRNLVKEINLNGK